MRIGMGRALQGVLAVVAAAVLVACGNNGSGDEPIDPAAATPVLEMHRYCGFRAYSRVHFSQCVRAHVKTEGLTTDELKEGGPDVDFALGYLPTCNHRKAGPFCPMVQLVPPEGELAGGEWIDLVLKFEE